MKKRYTSDPKQASRRNAFTNIFNNKKILLALLAFLLLGGKAAWAWSETVTQPTIYEFQSTDTESSEGNGTYKFKFRTSTDGGATWSNWSTTPVDYIEQFIVDCANTTDEVKLIFNTNQPVAFGNSNSGNHYPGFAVRKGILIMELGPNYSSTVTLKRTHGFSNAQNGSAPFFIGLTSTASEGGAATQRQLIIKGNDPTLSEVQTAANAYSSMGYTPTKVKQDTCTFPNTKQFVIDGGYTFTSISWNDAGTLSVSGSGSEGRLPMFRVQTGTLELTNVTIQNIKNSNGHAGIYVMTSRNASVNKNVSVKLTHCWMHHIYGGGTSYPGVGIQFTPGKNDGTGSVELNRCKLSYIMHPNGKDGSIRSVSGSTATLSVDSCIIWNNFGGGIRWQSLNTDAAALSYTTIKDNYHTESGGGIYAKAGITLSNCRIIGNKARLNGGGINYMTFDEAGQQVSEAGNIYPKNLSLTMDAATIIEGNKALTGDGGGVYIRGHLINLTAAGQLGKIFHEYNNSGAIVGPYKVELTQNGATIKDNEAYKDGGGVYIIRENNASSYQINCNLTYGSITGNKALHGNGGGVCLQQTGTPEETNDSHPAQDISFQTGGGANNLEINSNTAYNNGGAFYLYSVNDGSGWATHQKFNTKVDLRNKTTIQNNTASTSNGGGLYLEEGSVNIQQATIGGSSASLGNTANQYGGGIFVNKGSVTLLSTIIQYNKATHQSGGGIFLESGDVLINPNENETSTPTKIDHNIANLNGGGLSNRNGKVVIFGSFDSSHTYPVEITNNEATTGSGGGIFCIGDASSTEYDIRMRRVKIEGNKAVSGSGTVDINGSTVDKGCGGGIYLQEGKISIINGKLNENEANVSGGGVYTQSGNIDINPTREERQASEITNNTAYVNGGGLNTHHGKITVQGNDKDHRIIIKNNTATTGSGGGVFCMGEGSSTEYITMRHADLISNKAQNSGGNAGTGVTAGCGGGMYLQQGIISITDVNIQNNYAKVNGGGINNHSGNIDVDGCFIGSSHSTSGDHYYKADAGDDTDRGNKADQSGGGIYTHAGDIDIEDYMETSGSIFREESKVAFNEAAENGGGINTHQGTITINGKEMDDQIEISFNKANKGGGMYANAGTINAYNALIRDNTATQNGGGINNHSGNIALYGGILSNNTAELGHGGGAYTNVGDIDLFQFPSSKLIDVTLEDGTKVYNNIALKNGGAFNNHTGRVDIRHATLYNNTSTQGNGGAIFCEGPHANVNRGLGYTIRLLCSDMVQNKTRGQDGTEADPTGRGGGVYLKYGSIYAHYSNILNNEANIAGGGLDNHSGNILLYGCDIIGNRAIELDGGGIFTKQGHITTGPSTRRDGSPGSKATVIQKNSANYNGGGIYNQEGDITLNGDLIGGTTADLGNTAQKGDGGGVYIANGTINMKGGKIAYNTANSGNGGGVYSGGGEFNIEKRDDNPKPITLIVDVEVKRDGGGQTATIHYHLVDQGKYGVEVTNVKHGIVWGEGTPSTTVTYGETSGYTYAQGEPACQRITIPSITADKTYKVKSFFQYDYNSNTYTGYSDEMEFITYSNTLPTVISGTVSNITKNSAEGSGKIQDNGGSDITARGVKIWRTKIGEEASDPELLLPSSDGTDFFTVNLIDPAPSATELIPNTTYYACAYATNGSGTAYGATVEFTTLKDTPDMGSGPLTVTTDINSVGQIVVTASYTMPSGTTFGTGSGEVQGYGFVWSTDDDPELYADHTIAGVLSSGTTFTAQYVGAREGIAAYVRAYATYEESAVTSTSDPTNYSITKPKQFFTPYLNGDPVVRAIRISGITQNSATVTCKIYSGYNYGGATTVYGVHWENDNSYHPSTDYNPADSTYTVTLTGLTVNTTYYLKAYATNDGGTTYSYGNGYNFTTLPVSLPHVTITSISGITKTAANINCEVTDGGGTITDWGVKYSTHSNMADSIVIPQPAISNNTFVGNPTGLSSHTTYYVRAFATNSAGTHTSPKVTFSTDYDKPAVTNLTISNTAAPDGANTNATANFKVAAHSSDAADEVKTYGVCWSILHNPTRSISEVSDTHFAETVGSITSTTPANCVQNMTQRFPNTKYYVRAYASTKEPVGGNLTDTVYSSETSFITLPAMVTESASNVGTTSATLSGQIANRDSQGYLVGGHYGVCWGTSASPTVANDYIEYPITAANANVFAFSVDAATNISNNSTYHYRAYYKSSSGEIAYGADATFTTLEHGVTASANPAEGGSVSVFYNGNGTCTVTATANEGYTFANWTGGPTNPSTDNPYTFTIGSGYTLTANFTANSHNLTLTSEPVGAGTFTVNSSAYSTPVSITYNTSVTIEATPASGYTFVNWTDGNGDEVSSEANYTFNMPNADVSLTANFSNGRSINNNSTINAPRPRDIYPAPAREPWDWDDDSFASFAVADTLPSAIDSLIQLREQLNRDVVEPADIPMIDHNTAEYGGGVYMARNDTDRAKLIFSGGSSSAERGKIIFNTATEAGGGIYIDTTAHMWMKGHCEVNANNVPKNKDGAGVYLKGRLYVGKPGTGAGENGLIVNQNFAMDDFNEASYLANPTTYTENNKASLNNVCLTRHTYNYDHTLVPGTYDDESTVITLLSDITGLGAASNIGFHVTQGFCPVIATSTDFGDSYVMADNTHTPTSEPEYVNEGWLQNIMSTAVGTDGLFNSNGAIFEDTESYVAIHTRTTAGAPFNSKYIYLWGCWTHPAVKTDPEVISPMSGQTGFCGHYKITDNTGDILTWEIYSEEGLAWFSAYVNGLNVFATGDGQHDIYDPAINPFAKAVLKNDLDLSAHFWVPIGTATVFHGSDISSGLDGSGSLFEDLTDATSPEPHHFSGSFDGQGHTIKGIDCRYLSGIYKLGLFGYLDEGAVVKNVFVDNSRFEASDNAKGFHIGGIAGKTIGTATVSASEARSTIDITNAKKSESFVGGLVGQTVGTSGNPTIIHSSMAMPNIIGVADYMGGLVGQLGTYDKLLNSFSNPKFPNATASPYYDMSSGKYIGGLVGENNGIVENCYSRLQGGEPTKNGSTSVFGWLAGTNNSTGTINYCYAPTDSIDNGGVYKRAGDGTLSGHGTYDTTKLISGKYGFKHRDQAVTKAISSDGNTYINNDTIIGGLQRALNAWVVAKNTSTKTYHPWMRTMASPINDDYPIPNFLADQPSGGGGGGGKALSDNEDPRYNAVGSKDGVYMNYVNNANVLLKEYVTSNAATYPSPSVYLYDANTLADGTTAESIKVTNIGTTNPNVTFEIHEDVGITVDSVASSTGLKARVGVTFDNSNRSTLPELGGKPYDWHMFGSAINGVSMGLVYHGDLNAGDYHVWDNYNSGNNYLTNGIPNTIYNGSVTTYNREMMDPPKTQWYQSSNPSETTTYDAAKVGYFPTDTPYGTWRNEPATLGSFDFYAYGERYYQHWINFKRKGVDSFYDHWRQDPTEDGHHLNIPYPNEEHFINGKGYMMAVSERSMLMADGTLNNGNVTYTATYTVNPQATVYDEMVRGTNLIGNPYQSYLDFDKLADVNSSILLGGDQSNYYILDADSAGYISYTAKSSYSEVGATRYIHPHQGFFVKARTGGSLQFTNTMRVAGKYKSPIDPANPLSNFRNEQINYPLVNLLCFDANGKRDYTTVEINRPDVGGGQKMKGLRNGTGQIYARWDDIDYQTAFTPEGVSEVPVRFEAFEDGVFTMRWSMLHGDFHYVHLIDNLAGADVDMLTAQEYKFEGRTTDYISRFKLVFKVTDVDEYEDDDPGSKTFAFQMGDELIVNGAGILQMFDVTGRCLLSTQTAGAQSSVSLPKVAAGVYMLRLTGNQQNKVQKIIIK